MVTNQKILLQEVVTTQKGRTIKKDKTLSLKDELIFILLGYSDEDIAMLIGQSDQMKIDKEFINSMRQRLFHSIMKLTEEDSVECFIEKELARLVNAGR